jgi:hypothetical protein
MTASARLSSSSRAGPSSGAKQMPMLADASCSGSARSAPRGSSPSARRMRISSSIGAPSCQEATPAICCGCISRYRL